ncbi:MAG: twin-arginine translocation signal domain-containing protein [Bacteroidales bacterium]|jgi:hypothetical protein|nr:twin-arginine translocation signal domain-containing protein [Bacteroidales bacterium]
MKHKESVRRDFLKKLAIGGGGIIILGKFHFLFGNEPYIGILKAIVVDFDKWIEAYYTERGWDIETSKPTKEKLAQLGINFIA